MLLGLHVHTTFILTSAFVALGHAHALLLFTILVNTDVKTIFSA